MTENETTSVETTDPTEAVAAFLGSTPEKVTTLLTAVAVSSVYTLDYITDMVADALVNVPTAQ